MIKEEVNDSNMSSLYAQAYVMKCTNLLSKLDDMIVNVLLKPGNATLFYLDSIQVSAFFERSYHLNFK